MKRTLFYGATALGILFASCSSDDIVSPNKSEVVGNDQTLYVSMRISGDVSTSRAAGDDGTPVAGDFENGTGTESVISSAFFVFYDEDGNTVGDVVDLELDPTKWESQTDLPGTVEKYYKSVAKVSVNKGEKAPTQVVCYLNPVNSGNLSINLGEIQTLQLETATKGSGNSLRFPMSNSVYYADETATTPNIAVPLTLNVNIFTTEEEAENALAQNHYAEIYVERYASKLSFNATAAEQEDFVTGQRVWGADGKELLNRNKITLHFNPLYWAVNAEAKKTYVIKSFRQENLETLAPAEYNYTFAELNERINGDLTGNAQWVWNNPDFHRSYWGMSPAYFTNKYPEVSSDLDVNHSELQKYISFNELKSGKKGFAATQTAAQYFKETTVGRAALAAENPAAAVASVIYVGEYEVKVNDVAIPKNTGFYTYLSGPVPGSSSTENHQPYVYFENEDNTVKSKVTGAECMLKRFLIQCTVLYKKEGDSYVAYEIGDGTGFDDLTEFISVSQLTDEERIAYDGNDGTGGTEVTELKLQHNARTLRFTKTPGTDKNIYILTYNGYKQVVDNVTVEGKDTQMSVTEANIALAKNVGYALYYTLGHAYFNIPVRHYGWYRTGNENAKEGAIFDWGKVRVGDFGMVRNHSYQIEATKIEGLANGIGGDDVELVPPSSELNYYVSYQVHILKWAIVPPQKVIL